MKSFVLSACIAVLPMTATAAEEKPKAVETGSAPAAAQPAATAESLVEQIEEQLSSDLEGADEKEIAAAWQKRLESVDALIADFRKRFGSDPLRWKVSMLEANARGIRDELKLPIPKGSRGVAEIFAEILNSPDADAAAKAEASSARLIALGDEIAEKKYSLDAWETEFGKHMKSFPAAEDNIMLMELRLMLVEEHAPGKLMGLLEDLVKNPSPEISDMAKGRLALAKMKAELKGRPLDLKFTALDGNEIDLAKLRGKVVLIDFWASWCGPCMVEMPSLVKTYQALKGKGFEIIGISLDEEEPELKQALKAQGITWPQYFDGKGWENAYAKKYGIEGVPTMWLVNKAGMVVDMKPGDELAAKVEKLLAE